jgi:hypothetical protein
MHDDRAISIGDRREREPETAAIALEEVDVRPGVVVGDVLDRVEVLVELAAHLDLVLDYPGIFAIQKEASVVYPELIGMIGEQAVSDGPAPVLMGAARP